jgi:L-lactate dehydrogenase complex protein LldG
MLNLRKYPSQNKANPVYIGIFAGRGNDSPIQVKVLLNMPNSAKENILKKIREALSEPTPVPFLQSEGNSFVFNPPHDDLGVIFAEAFGKLDGRFVYCESMAECGATLNGLLAQAGLKKIFCSEEHLRGRLQQAGVTTPWYLGLPDCDASITTCECLVARTGTMVLSSTPEQGRTSSVYAPIHICIAYTSQLIYDTREALLWLKEKYDGQLPSLISFATGPSRTADIEKTLVKGIHGPKEVFCFLVEDGAPPNLKK